MMNKFTASLAVLAASGLALAQPAFAAEAIRSADVLPLLAASVGTVDYQQGMEATWHCARVTDESLGVRKKYVRVDDAGNVVLNAQHNPISCTPTAAEKTGHGFPWELPAGLALAGGAVAAAAGGGSNKSPN